MAVYPLRLIERSPIPRGFLPKNSKHKAMAYLYVEEDARLLACAKVPLPYRLLWGFLAREGMRLGEALTLTYADLDLTRGAVKLDRNKTDDARAWALSPGVADCLKCYREQFRKKAKPDSLVFVDEHGAPFDSRALPVRLRKHLSLAGVKRAELFLTTEHRMRMRVHDLRGTFVTVALANGRSESWISDRTGHKSSQMINHYKRTARTLNELGQGDFSPLASAISELAKPPEVVGHAGPNVGQIDQPVESANPEKSNDIAEERGFEPLRNHG
jgi:integrase